MEPAKTDSPKLPDMVMCGDHPSFTKTELNVKESKPDEKDKAKTSFARISPSTSRTERGAIIPTGGGENRRGSEHGLRLVDARRRVRSLEAVHRPDIEASPGNRALVQAALGSFRWPPYLLGVWVAVLVLTHLLHCIVSVLDRAMPNMRKACNYFKEWSLQSWRNESGTRPRVLPVAVYLCTAMLYAMYGLLGAVHAIALWSVEPLAADIDDRLSATDVSEAKVTNYVDEIASKTNMKH